MEILFLITAALLIFFIVRLIKKNPDSFSKANFSKSATTIGGLTLLVIVVVAVCVWALR